MFCLRTLRELKLLKFLSEAGVSENIISILDIIKPRSIDEFKEVYRTSIPQQPPARRRKNT